MKKNLTRDEVIGMLSVLPLSDATYEGALGLLISLLMLIIRDYPGINLEQFTKHFTNIVDYWDEKDSNEFTIAKGFMEKNKIWKNLVYEQVKELAESGCLYWGA